MFHKREEWRVVMCLMIQLEWTIGKPSDVAYADRLLENKVGGSG